MVYDICMEVLNNKSNQFTQMLFEVKPVKKINSERAYVLSQFVERLNVNIGRKYKVGEVWKVQKELKPSFVAFKVSHLSMSDLYRFLSDCKSSKIGFEKYFHWALKVQPKKVFHRSFDKK